MVLIVLISYLTSFSSSTVYYKIVKGFSSPLLLWYRVDINFGFCFGMFISTYWLLLLLFMGVLVGKMSWIGMASLLVD